MPQFLEFLSGVHFRVPVNEDGTLGQPQIIKRFTNPIKGAGERVARKKPVQTIHASQSEDIEL